MRKSHKANTLSEYAVVGALIGVAAVGGITLFGDSFNGLLGELGGDMRANITAANANRQTAQQAQAQQAAYLDQALQQEAEKLKALEKAVPSSALDTTQPGGRQAVVAVMTAGGLGVEQMQSLADRLQAILAKAKADGVDPNQIGWIEWAASAGYDTVSRMGDSWGGCPANAPCSDWDIIGQAKVWAYTYKNGVRPEGDQMAGQAEGLFSVYDTFASPDILPDNPEIRQEVYQLLGDIKTLAYQSAVKLEERVATADLTTVPDIDYTVEQSQQDVGGMKDKSDQICDSSTNSATCKAQANN